MTLTGAPLSAPKEEIKRFVEEALALRKIEAKVLNVLGVKREFGGSMVTSGSYTIEVESSARVPSFVQHADLFLEGRMVHSDCSVRVYAADSLPLLSLEAATLLISPDQLEPPYQPATAPAADPSPTSVEVEDPHPVLPQREKRARIGRPAEPEDTQVLREAIELAATERPAAEREAATRAAIDQEREAIRKQLLPLLRAALERAALVKGDLQYLSRADFESYTKVLAHALERTEEVNALLALPPQYLGTVFEEREWAHVKQLLQLPPTPTPASSGPQPDEEDMEEDGN
jgi:hypothetical protein